MIQFTDLIDKEVRKSFPTFTGVSVGEARIIFHGLNEAESQQALDMVNARLRLLDFQKDRKITEIKEEAGRRIDQTLPDWQTRRHRDQVELGVTTTLTAADYATKQQKCQSIRDASNAIEAEIQALTDRDAIIAFDITNHTAWPV